MLRPLFLIGFPTILLQLKNHSPNLSPLPVKPRSSLRLDTKTRSLGDKLILARVLKLMYKSTITTNSVNTEGLDSVFRWLRYGKLNNIFLQHGVRITKVNCNIVLTI